MEQRMVRTQVYLTEEQERGLKQLAASSGRKQSELIREAIDRLLSEKRQRNWLKSLEPMFGMWADRPEMDHFVRDLRSQADERLAEKWGWVKS
jgi:Arc/MetJ-type ribon-helix-helix transcriptional regulator